MYSFNSFIDPCHEKEHLFSRHRGGGGECDEQLTKWNPGSYFVHFNNFSF